MLTLRLKFLLSVLCLCAASNTLLAQVVSINPDTLPASITDDLLSSDTFIVNGASTYGLTDDMRKAHKNLGPIAKTLLAITTLKLVESKTLTLQEPISYTLPDILDSNPFRVAITPIHIATETTGMAVPVILSEVPLARYTTHMRTAGQMAHSDLVGWAILIRFLEAKSGQTIKQLLQENVIKPLGLQNSDLNIPKQTSALFFVTSVTGSGGLIAEVARLMVRNRTITGNRFLPPHFYDVLVKHHSWRMHPLAPHRAFGTVLNTTQGHHWLEPSPLLPQTGPTFMAFPEAGVSFVSLTDKTSRFRTSALAVANTNFLPPKPDNKLHEANLLIPYEKFNGNYVRSDAPSAWLKDRLKTIHNQRLHITENANGSLTVNKTENDLKATLHFEKQASFHYMSTNGQSLTLSPYKSGGYLLLDGILYRYAGILGNDSLVISLFPFVILILLSSGFYANSKTGRPWQKMGQFGSVGALLVCTGLMCDYLWWPNAIFEWDMPYLVNIWRAVMNIGLMLVLSLPLFTLSFTKRNEMPKGRALLYVPIHLGCISIAAVTLFLILVAWGTAGEFSAY